MHVVIFHIHNLSKTIIPPPKKTACEARSGRKGDASGRGGGEEEERARGRRSKGAWRLFGRFFSLVGVVFVVGVVGLQIDPSTITLSAPPPLPLSLGAASCGHFDPACACVLASACAMACFFCGSFRPAQLLHSGRPCMAQQTGRGINR